MTEAHLSLMEQVARQDKYFDPADALELIAEVRRLKAERQEMIDHHRAIISGLGIRVDDVVRLERETRLLRTWAKDVLREIENTGNYQWWHAAKADYERIGKEESDRDEARD